MANIENRVQDLVENTIIDLGYELYDIQYIKEGKDYYLRIYIDSKKGIDLEDCEKVSNEVSTILDKNDFIKEQYFLEISSPGIEKVLRKDKHLKDNVGKNVEVNLFKPIDKQKSIVGVLKDFDADTIEIEVENNILKIDRKNISLIKIKYNWE